MAIEAKEILNIKVNWNYFSLNRTNLKIYPPTPVHLLADLAVVWRDRQSRLGGMGVAMASPHQHFFCKSGGK